ncbi:protein OSB2, chloroplastic [Lycium ferocissimum]|uniref:protein OSB2, chloroplastic n=1 Tax=Lycium ferocissimum TaxID=112874 RepID=UPI0028158CF4|nr:protein OSB2, chloroplastic [Lycium ferocissimum]
MNFLTKSIANKSLFPKKCQLLFQTLTTLQQSSRFASTTISKSRKPKIPKPQEPSSSYVLTPPRIEIDEAANVSSWPKPSEIPYQAKVANLVNLVGFVQTPVKFEASNDGKYSAGTVVAHESSDDNSVLMIPVVFTGDLAHVVACHVKENDCVYVSGKFSMDPLLSCEFMDEYQSCFHIVAENVNFVQGLKRKNLKESVKSVYLKSNNQHSDYLVKQKDSLSGLEYDDSVNLGGGKLKEGSVTGGDDWRELIKNPKEWWDCRKAKLDGIVKARHPDFKKKDSSTSLWVENAPRWILEGLEGLEFDVYAPKPKGVGKEVDSWKDLVENPDNWWDNRANKLNPKAPDFKHKNTGIGLWVDSSPDWVLSRLPPLREQRAAFSDKQHIQLH